MTVPCLARDAAAASCVSCGQSGLHPVLDLGPMPRSDGLLDEQDLERAPSLVPLRMAICPACTLAQLLETRPPEDMFGATYLYFSSFSDDLLGHSRENARELIDRMALGGSDLVLEIASNDGYMLQNFQAAGIPVLGIDPAPQPAKAAQAKGIETRQAFFGTNLAATLRDEGLRPRLIIANNVVAHVADPNDLVRGIADLLSDDGIAVVEFPYVRDLIDRGQFDTIYHEHLCYFSVASAKVLFERHGLYLSEVRRLPIHGGSLRLYLRKQPGACASAAEILAEESSLGLGDTAYYADFGARITGFRTRARDLIAGLKAKGNRIAAYGAAAKGTILLNYLGLGRDTISYVVDRNPHKHGKYMPGVNLRIENPAHLLLDRPDIVILLPWNFQDEIIRQQADYLAGGGRFLIPTPDLEIVGG